MWLNNLKIYTPTGVIERGAIQLDDGRIADIVPGPAGHPGVDCAGLAAMPGVIDFHGDMLEREVEPRPGVNLPIDLATYEMDKRLAASGVTTAYAAISFAWHKKDTFRSENRARELIHAVHLLQDSLLTDLRVHTRFEITNPEAGDVLLDLLKTDQVHLISIMDHTPGQGQYRDIESYVKFAIKWRREKMGIESTAEEILANVEESKQRPKAWDAVQEIAAIARRSGIPLASHDDDTETKVAMLADLGVSVSEFPVTREAANAARSRGLYTVMGAPNALRGGSHSGNLSAKEAIREGLVDILAADYYPSAMLHAVYHLEAQGVLPVSEGYKFISQNVATALNLHDRGRLEPGMLGDLTLVQEGERVRVRGTLRHGLPIYWDHHMARLDGVGLSHGHWRGPVADLARPRRPRAIESDSRVS